MADVSNEAISSKAVMKYEVNSVLTAYRELDKHTDLNQPPANWLKDNIVGAFSDAYKKKRDVIDYSSLLMAHRYPDAIGEVDVVSAADSIKRLLKIPFSNRELSLTVNRIGKSLLLNDIDIPALVQQSTEIESEQGKLQWLRHLYCSALDAPDDSEIYPKKINKEESALQKILSKFIHHSIDNNKTENEINLDERALVDPVQKPPVVVPNDESPPVSGNIHQGFHRDILWNFEDITMLVGSDLPIFGGGKYPTVSLRLRDSVKPINILTGIDYWLDNLMCNVPEILMCYHDKGIVQKYEKIKTSELPFLEESSFSPKVIKDVAQNILSFLKSNCTKEGHTYWLFKSNKDDVIKLYDLTSIYEQSRCESSYNPFTLSVAMLLYRIACNMFNTDSINLNNVHRVRSMLEQCIYLLGKEKQHATLFWANFLLVDLLTKPLKESNENEDDDSDFTDDMDDSDATEDELKSPASTEIHEALKTSTVTSLCFSKEYQIENRRPSINNYSKVDKDNRSKDILTFVASALKLLQEVVKTDTTKSIQKLSDCKSMVSSFLLNQPINLFKYEFEVRPDIKSSKDIDPCSLQEHLIRKGVTAYLNLVSLNIHKKKFGRSLRLLRICSTLLNVIDKDHKGFLTVRTRMLFADILTILSKEKVNNIAELSDLEAHNQTDQKFLDCVDNCLNTEILAVVDYKDCFTKSPEDLLSHASHLYEKSLKDIGKGTDAEKQLIFDLTRRLGNIRNELGVLFMNKAASMAKCFGQPTETETYLWKKSFSLFERAIEAFEVVSDWANVALIHSNNAKLMRLCAQVYGYSTRSSLDESRSSFTMQEKTCYNKAFDFYRKAVSVFETKHVDADVKINICIEFSYTYFLMANTIQDYAPLNSMAEESVVKEVSSLLNKSKELCENVISTCTKKQKDMLMLRLGHIHQRLASLNHHMLRNQISDHGKKNYRSLAELNYKKACNYIDPNKHCVDYLKLFVEFISVYEYLLEQNMSVKLVTTKLNLFMGKDRNLLTSLNGLLEKFKQEDIKNEELKDTEYENEIEKIIFVLEKQLTTTFKEMLKYSSNPKLNKGSDIFDKNLSKKYLEIMIRGSMPNEKNMWRRIEALRDVLEKCLNLKIS